MLSFLADENFHGDVVRGLLLRFSELDIVRVQDVGLRGAADPVVLEWAASQQRIVLTHDVATMTRDAYARVNQGLSMPGLIEVSRELPIGFVIEEVLLIAQCGVPDDFDQQVQYLSR
jgi:hypothetical protein